MLRILHLWYLSSLPSVCAALWPYTEIPYLIVYAMGFFIFMVTFLCNVLLCSSLILCLETTA